MAREYSGKDTKISFLGREVACRSIQYQGSQSKENTYVLGSADPYREIVGRKEYEGTITLPQSEFEALVRSLPSGKDVLDIAPFDVVIIYVDEESNQIVTDILKKVSITEYAKEMENEDGAMDIELPIRISKVLLNVR